MLKEKNLDSKVTGFKPTTLFAASRTSPAVDKRQSVTRIHRTVSVETDSGAVEDSTASKNSPADKDSLVAVENSQPTADWSRNVGLDCYSIAVSSTFVCTRDDCRSSGLDPTAASRCQGKHVRTLQICW